MGTKDRINLLENGYSFLRDSISSIEDRLQKLERTPKPVRDIIVHSVDGFPTTYRGTHWSVMWDRLHIYNGDNAVAQYKNWTSVRFED